MQSLLRQVPSLGFAHFAFIRGQIAMRAIGEMSDFIARFIWSIGCICLRQVRADVEKLNLIIQELSPRLRASVVKIGFPIPAMTGDFLTPSLAPSIV